MFEVGREVLIERPSFQGVPSIFMHINVKTCPNGRVGTLRVKHQVSESFVRHEDGRGSSMRRPLRCDTHTAQTGTSNKTKAGIASSGPDAGPTVSGRLLSTTIHIRKDENVKV